MAGVREYLSNRIEATNPQHNLIRNFTEAGFDNADIVNAAVDPIFQIALVVEASTDTVKTMRHLVTDNRTDRAIIHCRDHARIEEGEGEVTTFPMIQLLCFIRGRS